MAQRVNCLPGVVLLHAEESLSWRVASSRDAQRASSRLTCESRIPAMVDYAIPDQDSGSSNGYVHVGLVAAELQHGNCRSRRKPYWTEFDQAEAGACPLPARLAVRGYA